MEHMEVLPGSAQIAHNRIEPDDSITYEEELIITCRNRYTMSALVYCLTC